MSRNESFEVVVAVHFDGGNGAVFVSKDGINANAVWIDRTHIRSIHLTGKTTQGTDRFGAKITLPMAHLTIPEWLAIKKELA